MSFNIAKIRYMTLDGVKGLPILQINGWKDFLSIVEEKTPKTIFHIELESRKRFLLVDGGLGFSFPSNGFASLDDVLDADKRGFDGCEKKFSFDYSGELYRGTGGSDSLGRIFYFVRKLGYDKLGDYEEAYEKGYGKVSAESYGKLTKAGWEKYDDVKLAKDRGFDEPKEFYAANRLEIPNKKTYEGYLTLEKIKQEYGFSSLDEAHLFVILNRSSLKKRKTVSDIQNILRNEVPRIDYYSTPEWYTESLSEQGAIEKFLASNPHMQSLGIFDGKEGTFENYSDTKIFVDGSNVAWKNLGRGAGYKPELKNIKLVVDKLHSIGFNEIEVLCDAKLRYDIDDQKGYDMLCDTKALQQVPKGTTADEFLIKFAKKSKSRIVTNDTFPEWAKKDPWVREHGYEISIRFVILGDDVEFTDIAGPVIANFKAKDFGFKGFDNNSAYRW